MITQPYPNFIRPDAGGNVKPISNGLIYIGKEGLDPVSNPIDVFYIDNAGTEQKIDQPIRLNATGIPVAGENDGTIILPYARSSTYSILITDKIGDEKYSNLTVTSYSKSNFTLRFDSIANMLAGIPVRSEPGDVCIVLDTKFKHESGKGFSITDFVPLSYRGGKAYEKTSIESLRKELSGVVDPALLQYGSRKLVNNPAFTDTIEDVANFAGQGQGSSAPTGWIHHHYTDGIMHQWDNVGDGTMLYLKNAQNPGRRPDKPSSYVGQGKFLSLGTEGFVGAGSERFFISKDVEFVYKKRQVAKFISDLDPGDGDGFAFIISCYRAMELVQKWSSGGDDLMYVRRAPNGQPQLRLFKNGAFGTDGLILDLNTANDGTVRILTGPTSSNIDAGAGDLNLRPSTDAGAGVYANGALKLKKYTTGDLPSLKANDRAIAWDITKDIPVKWTGSLWEAI